MRTVQFLVTIGIPDTAQPIRLHDGRQPGLADLVRCVQVGTKNSLRTSMIGSDQIMVETILDGARQGGADV